MFALIKTIRLTTFTGLPHPNLSHQRFHNLNLLGLILATKIVIILYFLPNVICHILNPFCFYYSLNNSFSFLQFYVSNFETYVSNFRTCISNLQTYILKLGIKTFTLQKYFFFLIPQNNYHCFLCHLSQNRANYPKNLAIIAIIDNFATSNDKNKKTNRYED